MCGRVAYAKIFSLFYFQNRYYTLVEQLLYIHINPQLDHRFSPCLCLNPQFCVNYNVGEGILRFVQGEHQNILELVCVGFNNVHNS